jgi:hypothetical protein
MDKDRKKQLIGRTKIERQTERTKMNKDKNRKILKGR